MRNLVLGLVVLLVGWLVYEQWSSDERRVIKQLETLRDLATKSPLENDLEGANRARKMADLFATEFEVVAEPEGYATGNRQDLLRGVMAYRSRSRSLAVTFGKHDVVVEGKRATVYTTVRFVNELGDLVGTESHPLRVVFVEVDRGWKIRKLEVLRETE